MPECAIDRISGLQKAQPSCREAPLWRSTACLSMPSLAVGAAKGAVYVQGQGKEVATRSRGADAGRARLGPGEQGRSAAVGPPCGGSRADEPAPRASQAVGHTGRDRFAVW
ncbi:hypothetical protein ERY430_80166 [Erythrobacter sp. EC-HK427]|nr:hypothetical protein ERY430_80166 [Erythrobacter sp. EC-HK427]